MHVYTHIAKKPEASLVIYAFVHNNATLSIAYCIFNFELFYLKLTQLYNMVKISCLFNQIFD